MQCAHDCGQLTALQTTLQRQPTTIQQMTKRLNTPHWRHRRTPACELRCLQIKDGCVAETVAQAVLRRESYQTALRSSRRSSSFRLENLRGQVMVAIRCVSGQLDWSRSGRRYADSCRNIAAVGPRLPPRVSLVSKTLSIQNDKRNDIANCDDASHGCTQTCSNEASVILPIKQIKL